MSHQQMTLNLLERIKNDTYKNQQRRTAKELSKLGFDPEDTSKGRHDSNQSKEE